MMNIYHFAIDIGQWDCDNWVAVADDIEIAKEKVIHTWKQRYGGPIQENVDRFVNQLNNASVEIIDIDGAANVWQSFD